MSIFLVVNEERNTGVEKWLYNSALFLSFNVYDSMFMIFHFFVFERMKILYEFYKVRRLRWELQEIAFG